MDYYAIMHDDKLPAYGFRRVSFLPVGNGSEIECAHCGKIIKHGGSNDRVLAAFCTREHFKEGKTSFLPELPKYAETKESVKSNKPKQCPHCKGPSTRGRGFSHKNDCPEKAQNKAKAASEKKRAERSNCPHCDGPPGKRRGWQHKKGCTRGKIKKVSQPCPKCGGPKRGKGYTHKNNCPVLQERAANLARLGRKKKRCSSRCPRGAI